LGFIKPLRTDWRLGSLRHDLDGRCTHSWSQKYHAYVLEQRPSQNQY